MWSWSSLRLCWAPALLRSCGFLQRPGHGELPLAQHRAQDAVAGGLGPCHLLCCPAPILLMYCSGRAQPGPSLSFHFYTTVYKRSDAFIAKQHLEQKTQETQYSGTARGI